MSTAKAKMIDLLQFAKTNRYRIRLSTIFLLTNSTSFAIFDM